MIEMAYSGLLQILLYTRVVSPNIMEQQNLFRLKNKAPAELQITAEQILLEAYERKEEPLKIPKQRIEDLEELKEYQLRKRKEFEQQLNKNRLNFGQWIRYGQFEIEQHDFSRARSVFERALNVNPQHVPIWTRYIQSELKGRNVNHARNLLDRAVTTLPRVDKLWYLYVQTEETLSNIIGTRNVFHRWMAWEPSLPAWMAYINFEKRYGEIANARSVFEKLVLIHPTVESWLKWVKFEQENGNLQSVRAVFSLAADSLLALDMGKGKYLDETLLISWAKWEASVGEYERGRAIFKAGLENIPKDKTFNLNNSYTAFEKQFGDKDGIEDAILSKRKLRYEEELIQDPSDYDTWWSYLSLVVQLSNDNDYIRERFEAATKTKPKSNEKKFWRRYIFLWIRYIFWEELESKDYDKSRALFERVLKLIPHKIFSFAKIWILYSKFEIRRNNLTKARKVLGRSIGQAPKPKIFKHYIELEKKLKEFDRVRTIFTKYIESFPNTPNAWIDFANFEYSLGETERCIAIYEFAVSDPEIQFPEVLWKSYIDFYYNENDYESARSLYERLLEQNKHINVWISYALFESTVPDEEQLEQHQKLIEETGDEEIEIELVLNEEAKEKARSVFERGITFFKLENKNDERIVLLEALKNFEEVHGSKESLDVVDKRLPTVVKNTRMNDNGIEEEYLDFVFPDDAETNTGINKFLENARKWMLQQQNSDS